MNRRNFFARAAGAIASLVAANKVEPTVINYWREDTAYQAGPSISIDEMGWDLGTEGGFGWITYPRDNSQDLLLKSVEQYMTDQSGWSTPNPAQYVAVGVDLAAKAEGVEYWRES